MSKPDASNLTQGLCFNCGAIFSVRRNASKKCPDCGYCPNIGQYENIMNYAISAVYYGLAYRQRYEEQLVKKGEIKKVFALPDPEIILIFFAVSALSGIVGNLSYDIMKAAFRAILKRAKKFKQDIGQNKINFTDELEVNIFIERIKEFHLNFQNINPTVKSAIKMEMLVWELSKEVESEINGDKLTKKDILKAVERVTDRAEHPQKPSQKDFNEFWKGIRNKDS